MSKSSQAFRTIREVADWLDVAAHVLRFWESKFPQIKPVKRAGGRRYYRPSDMELVGGIKVLLHDRGLTIRGVQKMIREEGVAAVAALSPPVDEIEDGSETIDGDITTAAWVEDAVSDHEAPDADETAEAADEESAPDLPSDAPDMAGSVEDDGAFPEPEEAEVDDARAEAPETDAEAPRSAPLEMPGADETPALARLAALAAGSGDASPGSLARLRPALVALRDRMRSDPPA